VAVVVTVSLAGTVSVMVPFLEVSATEVAVTVTVCGELVAAGAVKVAEVVVVLERAPPPLTVHVTPSGVLPVFLSLVTVAVSVTVSVASTVVAEATTATLGGLELPPHPNRLKAATIATPERTSLFKNIETLLGSDVCV
jgi:hypothetical protein